MIDGHKVTTSLVSVRLIRNLYVCTTERCFLPEIVPHLKLLFLNPRTFKQVFGDATNVFGRERVLRKTLA